MLVHNQPFTFDFAVHIGDPDCEVNWLPPGVRAADMLDAVAEAQRTIRRHIQRADFELHRAMEGGEELLPILPVRLGTDILAWRRSIEHNQRFVRHIDPHDGIDILGTEGGSKLVFECSDLGLVVPRGICVRCKTGMLAPTTPRIAAVGGVCESSRSLTKAPDVRRRGVELARARAMSILLSSR
jgi:hypothetical protein